MNASSRRQQILEAVQTRLRTIRANTVSPGGQRFQTDAGQYVFVNETPSLGPDDPESAIAVVVGEDQVLVQGNKVIVTLPLEVQALASSQREGAWQFTEPVLADIKRALEVADRTLGGLVHQWLQRGSTRTLERDEGSTTVGVGLAYVATYSETWGSP